MSPDYLAKNKMIKRLREGGMTSKEADRTAVETLRKVTVKQERNKQ